MKIQFLALASVMSFAACAHAEPVTTWTQNPSTEIQWGESGLGPLVSPLIGNTMASEHVTYFRFPGGATLPMHTHEHGYTGIVVSGVMRHYVRGEEASARQLPAGSNWSMPGTVEHVSECLPGAECIAVMIQDGAFDLHYIE